MTECPSITLQNSNATLEEDSRIRGVLNDVERLIAMLSTDLEPNIIDRSTSSSSSLSPQTVRFPPSFLCPSPSTTMTTVTHHDENHYRLIEHLRTRVARLEHERNVLLTSYQLLIQLLK